MRFHVQVDKADDAYHETEGNRKREEREREVNIKEEEKRKKKDEETKRKEEEEEKRVKATKEENKKEKMKRKRKNRKLRKTGDSTVSSTGMEIDEDSTEEIPQPDIKKKKKELPTKSRKPGATDFDASNNQGKPRAPSSALTRPQTTPQLGVSQPPTALQPDLSRPPPSVGPFQPSGPQIPTSFDFNQGPRIHKGTVDIQALMDQEAALKQLLFEQSY